MRRMYIMTALLIIACCAMLFVAVRPAFAYVMSGTELAAFSISEEDALYIAQTIYGEAGSDYIPKAEKAMVAWVILNRLDDGYGGASSVYEVVSSPGQFYGWLGGTTPPENLMEIARDVLRRHAAAKAGYVNVGRVLPPGYYYFYGDGVHNYFNNGGGGVYDFSAQGYPSPY